MDYNKLADLLFPEIDKDIDYYLNIYPKRDLPDGAMVTRVAPSPTGYLHIGTVYQALINKKLANQTGGVFYLRLEDTDSKREVEGAANIMYPCLKDFGVEPEEGFISFNEEKGNYGPYVQSRRVEIYKTFAKHLVRKGLAYPCFCEFEDGEEDFREEQKRLGIQTGYYGIYAKCRNLTLEEIEENLKRGKPFKIRIKADGDGRERVVFKDKLRGNLSYPKNFMDYVILKSDGMALYHLGHLVDDSLMHTTCVIRDESWLPSTPLHKQLFEYFNLPAPEYLHTAQILTLDEKTGNARKVSKRYDPWADSRAFLDEGYPSESIIEYLLTIINSDFEMWRAQNPSLSYKDFKLNISKMGKSGAQFDHDKLKFISKNVISRFTNERVYADVCAWAEKYDKEFYNLLVKYKDYCLKMFNIERNNNKPRKDIAVYSDVKNLYYYFFDEYFNDRSFVFDEAFDKNDIKTLLNRYVESYDENDDHDTWFSKIKHLGEDLGFASDMKEFKQNKEAYKGNYANISGFIRMALTSETNTPDLYEICKLLKKDRIKQRIENLNKSL